MWKKRNTKKRKRKRKQMGESATRKTKVNYGLLTIGTLLGASHCVDVCADYNFRLETHHSHTLTRKTTVVSVLSECCGLISLEIELGRRYFQRLQLRTSEFTEHLKMLKNGK